MELDGHVYLAAGCFDAFLAAIPARVGGPALVGTIGWPGFFALATPLYVASLWLLGAAMRRTKRTDSRDIDQGTRA